MEQMEPQICVSLCGKTCSGPSVHSLFLFMDTNAAGSRLGARLKYSSLLICLFTKGVLSHSQWGVEKVSAR